MIPLLCGPLIQPVLSKLDPFGAIGTSPVNRLESSSKLDGLWPLIHHSNDRNVHGNVEYSRFTS